MVDLDQTADGDVLDLDASALTIHGAVHAALPGARVLLHCHPDYATDLSTLKDPTIRPIDQNTCLFHLRIAYDLSFGGLGDTAEEGARVTAAMGNHGVLVSADSVAQAFELLYYLQKASKTMVLASSTGHPLNELPPDVAQATADG